MIYYTQPELHYPYDNELSIIIIMLSIIMIAITLTGTSIFMLNIYKKYDLKYYHLLDYEYNNNYKRIIYLKIKHLDTVYTYKYDKDEYTYFYNEKKDKTIKLSRLELDLKWKAQIYDILSHGQSEDQIEKKPE